MYRRRAVNLLCDLRIRRRHGVAANEVGYRICRQYPVKLWLAYRYVISRTVGDGISAMPGARYVWSICFCTDRFICTVVWHHAY